jgi:hypothetical protein
LGKWDPPSRNVAKLNFDGASKGNPVTAMKEFSSSTLDLGRNSTNVTEAATISVLNLLSRVDFLILDIEGDSPSFIRSIMKGFMPHCRLNDLTEEAIRT